MARSKSRTTPEALLEPGVGGWREAHDCPTFQPHISRWNRALYICQRRSKPCDLLVVPYSKMVTHLAHTHPLRCHLGVENMMKKIRDRFHWPGMLTEVQNFVQQCEQCQQMSPRKPPVVPLVPFVYNQGSLREGGHGVWFFVFNSHNMPTSLKVEDVFFYFIFILF